MNKPIARRESALWLSSVLGEIAAQTPRCVPAARVRVVRPAMGTSGGFSETRRAFFLNLLQQRREKAQTLSELGVKLFSNTFRAPNPISDILPRGDLVLLRNRAVPGVIGRVGTALAAARINIGQYNVARLEAGGLALAAIGVDAGLSTENMETLMALPEVTAVRQVELD